MTCRRQRGHAMAETLAVALASIPLLLLIPVIGKLQDIRHATQMASRSVAFDAAVARGAGGDFTPHGQLADEIRSRHFTADPAGLRTGQRPSQARDAMPPLWTDPLGNPWIARIDDIRVGWGPQASPNPEDGTTAASDGQLFNLVPGARARSLGLQAPGVLTGRVEVPLGRLPAGVRAWEPFDRLDLTLRAQTGLLVDGWAARSPEGVEQRVEALVGVPDGLAFALGRVAGLGIEALELGHLPAPRVGQLEVWRDVVPADRLRGAPR